MPPKMKKAHKSIASDASLHRKEEHVSSEIKGKLGSGTIDGKGHSKLKMPCLTKTTQESGKKKENLAKKDKHVSSEIKGKLGSGTIDGKGHSKSKMPCLTKTTQESGKKKENLAKKDKHVSPENKGRLGNRSGGEGDCNAKTFPKINKSCESGKSTGSLDRKKEHVSLKNEGKLGNRRSNGEGEPHLMGLSEKKKQPGSRKKNQSHDNKDGHGSLEKDEKKKQSRKKNKNQSDPNLKMPSKMKESHKLVVPLLSKKLAQKMRHSRVYEVTAAPFHKQCGITPTTFPWVEAATTHETISFHNQCVITPTISSWIGGAATTSETISFNNQCVITPTISPSVRAATTHVTISYNNQCGITPIVSPWGEATTHETIPFNNQCGIIPTISHRLGAETTRTTYKPTTKKKKQESGKRTENLHKKDKHVSSENNCGLGNSGSVGEGDCNLKIISNRKKRCEPGKSNGSPDRKEEHVSSKNEGRLSNSMDQDHAWMNLNKSVGDGTHGRRIGKLLVSNTEIAKGSSGTIILEGSYEGRSVAVKRLVQAHSYIASQEIQSLRASDGDPNIVRLYGAEQDQDFMYLALERCACSLDDLIRARSKSSGKSVLPHDPASNAIVDYKMHVGSIEGTMQDVNLWRDDGHPSPLLLKLMREVVSGLVHLHRSGIIHRDLKPQNILITKELCAKLSDMAISRLLPGDPSSSEYRVTDCGKSGLQASEKLCPAQQTSSVDSFDLGCVLFFCITGGRHPFGDGLKGKKSTMDLSPVEFMPEAADLVARLLNRDPNLRPKALEVLHHPLFWNSKTRLSFLRDISDWVKSKAWGTNSDALEKLESIAQRVFDKEWKEKIDCEFMKHMRKFTAYEFKRVKDLLRIVRNTFSHYREFPPEIQEIVGSSPEDLDCYFTRRFPRLLIETYRFVSMSCKDKEPSPFPEYFNS